MKQLHRPDLFAWSSFDEPRNIDFNSYVWKREGGNVVFDPLPMSPHDRQHLTELGGATWIVITNSDHVRESAELAEATGAAIAGPFGEKSGFPIPCQRWLSEGDELVPGLRAMELVGSKTPGELALVLEGTTLITGDLVRAQAGGRLNLLPDAKLSDPAAARTAVQRLSALEGVEAVLVGDGWPVFRDAGARLQALCATFG